MFKPFLLHLLSTLVLLVLFAFFISHAILLRIDCAIGVRQACDQLLAIYEVP